MSIADYPHRSGAHCGSASLRNLAAHYGWGLDEPLCFGLGAGIGFGYYEAGPASRTIMGRSSWLESGFFETLAIPFEEGDGENWEIAWEAVSARLADGTPVVLFADLYYLDYYGTDTHFGPHTLVCLGTEGDDVLLSDSEFESVQRLPIDRLRQQAWGSEHGFVGPLSNRWLAIDGERPSPDTSIESAARVAIARATKGMLTDGESGAWGTQGLEGIRRFARELPEWTGLDDASWSARFAYQNIERRGTGGGAFRRLYADFLAQLDFLDDSFADRTRAIADDWRALGETLRAASETPTTETFERAGEQAATIADHEEELFVDLREGLEND
ncbi:BtrH N-terminal domain-containing protein [Halococcus qingdaonensis]|uniref:BtrH N-terminal domain-containing protein n=1 Tax=Halococcus qingdaonensis TaxID=224402 RepID=UPI0021165B65|nr:BtrH N-terminal domain-containing protein [Halococcus qingdaonensis]